METNQSKLWEGIFGDAYQDRNIASEDEIEKRQNFWESLFTAIYANTGYVPRSVLEIGAGQGQNLIGLERAYTKAGIAAKLYATEINQKARIKLAENAPNVEILTEIPDQPTADLVFTYGVMIHIHPAHIKALHDKMYKASTRLLGACEYFAPVTRPIPYRGEKDALWLDDYGSHLMKNCPLSVLAYGFSWKPQSGLDNITFWVFEKKSKLI